MAKKKYAEKSRKINMARYTNEQIVEMYKSQNFNKSATVRKLGMCIQNLYRLMSNDPELKAMLKAAEEERLDIAEDVLFQLIKEKNFQAVKFFLETKGRKRGYANKIEVTHIDESAEILKALERKYADDL